MADTIFTWFGPTFSLRHYIQMLGRPRRSGQMHTVMTTSSAARKYRRRDGVDALITNNEERQNQASAAPNGYGAIADEYGFSTEECIEEGILDHRARGHAQA